jgi:hypothetical protein
MLSVLMKKLFADKSPQGDLEALLGSIPDKWLVYRLNQTPAFLLWDCVLFQWDHEGDSGRVIECSENDTAAGALRCCLSRLNGGKRLCRYECGHTSE